MRTRVRPRSPARFARATASASSLTSVAHTSASGSSASSASAIAPEPVPRSATRRASARRRPAEVGAAPGAARAARASSIATSHDLSVSGRGISTRRSTSRSSPRNDHEPSTYCSGSPATRRSTSSCERAHGARRSAARRRSSSQLGGVVARHLLDHPARLGLRRRRSRPPRAARDRRRASRQRRRQVRARVTRPPSWRRALVGRERVDDLVELAGEHLVEGVHA